MIKFIHLPKFIGTPIYDTINQIWVIPKTILFASERIKITYTDGLTNEIPIEPYFDFEFESQYQDKANLIDEKQPIENTPQEDSGTSEDNPTQNEPNEENQNDEQNSYSELGY